MNKIYCSSSIKFRLWIWDRKGPVALWNFFFFLTFVNRASNFGVVPRVSIRKVKLCNRECKCNLNRRNGVALVEGKIRSFLGPENNFFGTITYSCSSWAITEPAIPLRRWDWHSPTNTFINSSKYCQALFQLPRTSEEVELLRTQMFAFFEMILRAWLPKLLKY